MAAARGRHPIEEGSEMKKAVAILVLNLAAVMGYGTDFKITNAFERRVEIEIRCGSLTGNRSITVEPFQVGHIDSKPTSLLKPQKVNSVWYKFNGEWHILADSNLLNAIGGANAYKFGKFDIDVSQTMCFGIRPDPASDPHNSNSLGKIEADSEDGHDDGQP
jgi:hypothetical protein